MLKGLKDIHWQGYSIVRSSYIGQFAKGLYLFFYFILRQEVKGAICQIRVYQNKNLFAGYELRLDSESRIEQSLP